MSNIFSKKMIMPFAAVFCFFLLFCTPAVSFGDIYGYIGSNGVINLTNVPAGNPKYKLIMHTIPTAIARSNFNYTNKKRYQSLIKADARRYHLSPALLNAIITVESGFNPGAVSPVGAMGLMQLMPSTAARFNVSNAFNPAQNIRGGAEYIKHLIRKFNGNIRLALAAYNAGSGAVIQAGYHIPPYPQTQNYVPEVLSYYRVDR